MLWISIMVNTFKDVISRKGKALPCTRLSRGLNIVNIQTSSLSFPPALWSFLSIIELLVLSETISLTLDIPESRILVAPNRDTKIPEMEYLLCKSKHKGDVTRYDSQRRFLAKCRVETLLRHCLKWWQHCSNIATLCCTKDRRSELSRVTSP